MLRFLSALLPHLLVTGFGALVGVVLGLVLDVALVFQAGLGPAAAHVGPVVLILLAAVPLLYGAIGTLGGLGLSLIALIGRDAVKGRWRRRSTVRTASLALALYPWSDLLGAAPEGGWTAPLLVVLGVFSAVGALAGCVLGLVIAQIVPHRAFSPKPEISAQ